jgi:hypothetical protein
MCKGQKFSHLAPTRSCEMRGQFVHSGLVTDHLGYERFSTGRTLTLIAFIASYEPQSQVSIIPKDYSFKYNCINEV